jgi:hypothetical protein
MSAEAIAEHEGWAVGAVLGLTLCRIDSRQSRHALERSGMFVAESAARRLQRLFIQGFGSRQIASIAIQLGQAVDGVEGVVVAVAQNGR